MYIQYYVYTGTALPRLVRYYLIFVLIKVRRKIFHQKNTNLVKFDLKEAIFSDFLNGI